MDASDKTIVDLAGAILDGRSIDWESVASSVEEPERPLLDELKVLAAVADLHRHEPASSVLDESYWGHLRLFERVGRGTFGDVYRAWDSRLDREVALKILRRKERDDESHASTVIQEGRLLARVRHPNVVTVYGAERINGQTGVWMEFVHGNTLEEELRHRGPFDVDRVIRIGIELSGALSTVHSAGLIHGDVKAQNVLCDRAGRLVLTDFGAGIQLDETADGARCDLATTPLCAAPEVLAGEPALPRSDLYGLAVLLYHLLTGTYPVRGRSLKELREAHTNRTRVPLHQARPDIRDGLVHTIDRALDPDPAGRQETLDIFHEELRQFVSPDTSSRRKWFATLVLLAGVAIALSIVYRTQLSTNVSPMIRSAMPRWPTVVPEAFELYLRGSAAAERGGQSATVALQLFEQAIALDPAFAQAHAAIALVTLDQRAVLALPAGQRYERAKAAADIALALDMQLPEAHLAAAKVKSAIQDWTGADREYRRATELAPNRSLVREEYATWLALQGRFTEAIVQADRSVALDPISPRSHYTAGLVRRFARQCQQAGTYLDKALELDPQYGPAHHEIGQCHQMAGRHDLAIEEYRRGAQVPGNLGHTLAAAGRTAEARRLLAELIERQRQSRSGSSPIAMIYVGLGEYDRALDWLERDSSLLGATPTFKVAAVWDPLRSSPRFTEILRKRGLAPK